MQTTLHRSLFAVLAAVLLSFGVAFTASADESTSFNFDNFDSTSWMNDSKHADSSKEKSSSKAFDWNNLSVDFREIVFYSLKEYSITQDKGSHQEDSHSKEKDRKDHDKKEFDKKSREHKDFEKDKKDNKKHFDKKDHDRKDFKKDFKKKDHDRKDYGRFDRDWNRGGYDSGKNWSMGSGYHW